MAPSAIKTFADFHQLPLLEKRVVQKQWSAFISEEFAEKDLIARYTSGSAGQPLKCVLTPQERLVLGRHMIRARLKSDLKLPARWLILGGAVRFVSGQVDDEIKSLHKGGGAHLVLPALELSPLIIEDYLKKIQTFQPSWIYAMPSTLSRIAIYACEQGRQLKMQDLHLIELVGEFLPERQRQVIESVFQVRPTSQYACREVWGIGFECKYGLMHLITENVYVEILRDDGSAAQMGEVGEVVITGLNNRAQTFIRYQLGDLASIHASECPCGNPRPYIRLVGGRTTEKIFGAEDKIGSFVFDSIVRAMCQQGLEGISQYRVIQRHKDQFEVQIVKSVSWVDQCQLFFEEHTRQVLGDKTQLKFLFVDDIAPSASGKSKSFIVEPTLIESNE